MSSQAQINANRANSQFSSGPKTEAGKKTSSLNAVKTALTGQTILLPNDDVAAYQKLGQVTIECYRPANYMEELLVQSIIDAEWRLLRIPSLESGIKAIGHNELTDQFPADQLDVQIYLKYQRELKNLSLQETRLRRMKEKDLASLKQMQAERQAKEEEAKKQEAIKEEAKKAAAPNSTPEKTVAASAVALFNEAKQAAAADPSLDISGIGFEFAKAAAA